MPTAPRSNAEQSASSSRAQSLRSFLTEVRTLIGDEHVIEDRVALERRSRETGPVTVVPPALIYPGNTDEIRSVVLVANRNGVKFHVASRGLNYGYGGNNFIDETAVVMVLERMNRVLEVNE